MSYTAGEALILTRVRACSNFDSNNTSRANWRILNKGNAAHYAVIRPGPFEIEWITVTKYLARWTTVVELWQRYTTDGDSETNLYARIADLFPIMQYPRLGDTTGAVLDSTIRSAGEPEEMWPKDGGPTWLRWQMVIDWQEEVNVTFQE